MTIIRTLTILTVLVFSLPTVTFAENQTSYSLVYQNSAIKLEEKGQIRLAAEQYVKALIADPTNLVARDSLKMLCLKEDGWVRSERKDIIHFLDQIDQVGLIMTQLSQLRETIQDAVDFINSRGEQEKTQAVQFALENAGVNLSERLPFLLIKDENIFTGPFSVGQINQRVKEVKRDLHEHFIQLQAMSRNLRKVKKEIIVKMPAVQSPSSVTDMRDQLKDVMLRLAMKDDLIDQQDKNIEKLRTELITVKTDFEQVIFRMNKNEQRVVELTKELVDMTLEVHETENVMSDKEERSTALRTDLQEANERLALTQRIIQEKDEKITELADQMTRLEETSGKNEVLRSQGIEVLRKEFFALQTELQAQSKDSLDKISLMEVRLGVIQDKYKALESVVLNKEGEVLSLKADVLFKDEKISKLKKIFDSKDEKLIELMGILDIYKEKLKESKGLLEAKELKIEELDHQIDEIDRRLDDVDISATEEAPVTKEDAISFILNGGRATGRPVPFFLR